MAHSVMPTGRDGTGVLVGAIILTMFAAVGLGMAALGAAMALFTMADPPADSGGITVLFGAALGIAGGVVGLLCAAIGVWLWWTYAHRDR